MENYRSKSYRDQGRMEIYYGGGGGVSSSSSSNYPGGGGPRPSSMQDLRCYSANNNNNNNVNKEMKLKKVKNGGMVGSLSKSLSLSSDPELQRKKRVASYKVYSVEGKMKGSLKKSVRWIKNTFVYGSWW